MTSYILSFLIFTLFLSLSSAQNSTGDGYFGYSLEQTGDPYSTIYATNETDTAGNASLSDPPPDVFLNATVHVGTINLTVTNITAKINLEAQVLSLLQFNAGISASINRVELLIEEVNAKVLLEARLGNLVTMIGDVLDSLDLNPVLVTLGQDVTNIVNTTVGDLTGSSSSTTEKRSYNLANNILYSINDYSGHTHTNRILAQNGSIIQQSLDNNGHIYSEGVVGYYAQDMTFNGYNRSVTLSGQADREIEYVYNPFIGLSVVSAIYLNAAGKVVATQVLSESGGGGGSTIGS